MKMKRMNNVRIERTAQGTPRVHRVNQRIDLYRGDCLAVLRKLPDKSVDCVITSPPYWRIRDYGGGTWTGGRKGCSHRAPEGKSRIRVYGDTCPRCSAKRLTYPLGMEPTIAEFILNLCLIFDEVWRVLKDTGSLWVNMGDTYASRDKGIDGKRFAEGCLLLIPARFSIALMDRGWVLRNEVIWQKPSVRPSGVKTRLEQDYELLFHFTKQSSPNYYYDQLKVPGVKVGIVRPGRTVWTFHSGMNACKHDSAFAERLVEIPVLSTCPPSGVVVDIFLGTGTTGLVAAHYGRDFIGIELDKDYFNRTCARFSDEGFDHRAIVPPSDKPRFKEPKPRYRGASTQGLAKVPERRLVAA